MEAYVCLTLWLSLQTLLESLSNVHRLFAICFYGPVSLLLLQLIGFAGRRILSCHSLPVGSCCKGRVCWNNAASTLEWLRVADCFLRCAGALEKVAQLPGGADAVEATRQTGQTTMFPVKLM